MAVTIPLASYQTGPACPGAGPLSGGAGRPDSESESASGTTTRKKTKTQHVPRYTRPPARQRRSRFEPCLARRLRLRSAPMLDGGGLRLP